MMRNVSLWLRKFLHHSSEKGNTVGKTLNYRRFTQYSKEIASGILEVAFARVFFDLALHYSLKIATKIRISKTFILL